ncbi:MAG: hypothetical protein A3B68_05930 [Candidatus Melainabacteria bacterium RIFCSPHIGHO2_02_FULL_34_12]|nr:MAG: hypothetical protein A3B68_05930 [Candidatus Melainabacteria bacterium RIFCSPHIGHO2_02_FULL_34_12]
MNGKRFYFWFLISALLFLPICNSFLVNIQKLLLSVNENKRYRQILGTLNDENIKLSNKVRYYQTENGIKTLIRDRLNKVEKDEVLIKIQNKNIKSQ